MCKDCLSSTALIWLTEQCIAKTPRIICVSHTDCSPGPAYIVLMLWSVSVRESHLNSVHQVSGWETLVTIATLHGINDTNEIHARWILLAFQ